MHRQFAKGIFILALTVGFLFSQGHPIQADNATPTSTPINPISATQTAIATTADPNSITFFMLRQPELHLVGPYDSKDFSFSLPADWQLLDGAQLEISLGISFNTIAQNLNNPLYNGGGTLTVLLDNQVLAVIPFNKVGETVVSLPIPLDQIIASQTGKSISVSFNLNSGLNCNVNQNTDVFIHPTSRFILPHTTVKPDTSLVNFPRPIYQNLFQIDSALVVVPDKPTAAELKSALIVSAGLSNLTANNLLLDLTTISKLTPDQLKANHIILVGNAPLLTSLNQLNLPLPVSNNQFQISGGNVDDGVIEMVNSPWSNAHVFLIVSGNTDAGTVKAAQAISTGIIQPNRAPNIAVIDKVNSNAALAAQIEDRTMTELGYKNVLVQNRGVSSTRIIFSIPPGYTLAADAYFDLIYGNSALLDYNRSGIVVQLNNRPIGSVRMDDASAGSSTNKAHIVIPPSAIIPGRNVLQIITNLVPVDDCTPPSGTQDLWVNIWPESLLHLPLATISVVPVQNQMNLASYLPSFLYNPQLSDTAFVLPANNTEAWRSAVQIAAYLGDQANSPIYDLSVFYGDAVPQEARSKFNFLVIGRPSEIPLISELNKDLPAPFSANSDIPATNNTRIVFRIVPENPLGFIEIMPSSWNPNKIVLTVLGNSNQGINWATAALVDSKLNWHLAGNFAIIIGTQVLINDTSILAAGTENLDTQTPNEPAQTPTVGPNVPVEQPSAQPMWILPALLVVVILIVLILAIVIFRGWSRNRTRHKRG